MLHGQINLMVVSILSTYHHLSLRRAYARHKLFSRHVTRRPLTTIHPRHLTMSETPMRQWKVHVCMRGWGLDCGQGWNKLQAMSEITIAIWPEVNLWHSPCCKFSDSAVSNWVKVDRGFGFGNVHSTCLKEFYWRKSSKPQKSARPMHHNASTGGFTLSWDYMSPKLRFTSSWKSGVQQVIHWCSNLVVAVWLPALTPTHN